MNTPIVFALALLFIFPAAWADSVDKTRIKEFQPGARAVAQEVNGNFAEIVRASDDNALQINQVRNQVTSDINSVNSNINTLKGTLNTGCPAGSAIRQIDNNGNIACEVDDVGTGGTGGLVSVVSNAGSGINVNTTGATATVSADTAVLQKRIATTCTSGQVMRGANADGTPICIADANSGGDISEVVAGDGLSGGGVSGGVTISVDKTLIQARVTGVCTVGSAIREVKSDGTVICDQPSHVVQISNTSTIVGRFVAPKPADYSSGDWTVDLTFTGCEGSSYTIGYDYANYALGAVVGGLLQICGLNPCPDPYQYVTTSPAAVTIIGGGYRYSSPTGITIPAASISDINYFYFKRDTADACAGVINYYGARVRYNSASGVRSFFVPVSDTYY